MLTDPAEIKGNVLVMNDRVAPQTSFALVMSQTAPRRAVAPPPARRTMRPEVPR